MNHKKEPELLPLREARREVYSEFEQDYENHERVEYLIERLRAYKDPRIAFIVESFYRPPYWNFADIGEALHLTGERIRHLHERAYKLMRLYDWQRNKNRLRIDPVDAKAFLAAWRRATAAGRLPRRYH